MWRRVARRAVGAEERSYRDPRRTQIDSVSRQQRCRSHDRKTAHLWMSESSMRFEIMETSSSSAASSPPFSEALAGLTTPFGRPTFMRVCEGHAGDRSGTPHCVHECVS